MARHNKVKQIHPPVMVNTQVATDIVKTNTPEEYKISVEKEYAPQPIVEPKKVRIFVGVGTYLPTINGKNIKISFPVSAMNRYSTCDEDVIKYLVGKGFKEIE
jgi:hypothetical protein